MTWLAYGALLLVFVTVLTGFPLPLVLAVFIMAAIGGVMMMGIGLYATIIVKCPECGNRFYSLVTPFWPFAWPMTNHCVSCSHEVDVF